MTNLEIMTSGVKFSSSRYGEYYQGASQTDINRYASDCMYKVCTADPVEWESLFQGDLKESLSSLRRDDIKHELLKHAVNVTAYNRVNNSSEASYLSTNVDVSKMSDDRVAAAISNLIESGRVEESYSLLDDADVLQSCVRSFVFTVNDSMRKDTVPYISEKDSRANKLIDSLDVHYARWKNVGTLAYNSTGYGRK